MPSELAAIQAVDLESVRFIVSPQAPAATGQNIRFTRIRREFYTIPRNFSPFLVAAVVRRRLESAEAVALVRRRLPSQNSPAFLFPPHRSSVRNLRLLFPPDFLEMAGHGNTDGHERDEKYERGQIETEGRVGSRQEQAADDQVGRAPQKIRPRRRFPNPGRLRERRGERFSPQPGAEMRDAVAKEQRREDRGEIRKEHGQPTYPRHAVAQRRLSFFPSLRALRALQKGRPGRIVGHAIDLDIEWQFLRADPEFDRGAGELFQGMLEVVCFVDAMRRDQRRVHWRRGVPGADAAESRHDDRGAAADDAVVRSGGRQILRMARAGNRLPLNTAAG